jgi:hypothetical protein
MVTPLDVIPAFHQAFRNDMRKIDNAALKAAQGKGDLSLVIDRLRLFQRDSKVACGR